MTFPTMTSTWKFSTVGLTNVIPLVENGGPYTVGLDKAGGTYTAQLFWSPDLDASFKDDSWIVLTDLNTTDESAVTLPSTARAIMGSITVRPTPVVSGGISTPIAKFEISVATTNPKGVQNRQRHASGYGSNLIGGSAPVQDEYAALVLADMGGSTGSFFEMQDSILSPLTDTGPDGITGLIDASGITLVDGPWAATKGHSGEFSMSYVGGGTVLNIDASQEETWEYWIKLNTLPAFERYHIMSGGGNGALLTLAVAVATDGNVFTFRGNASSADALGDPGAWLVSTAYVVGDRVRAAADNSRMAECTIAGTSAACEPTWPTDGTTVVDGGTLTWEDCGDRSGFHDWIQPFPATNGQLPQIEGTTVPEVGRWYHVVGLRTSLTFALYVNGVKENEHVIANLTGSQGTPGRNAFTVSYFGNDFRVGNSSGGSEGIRGDLAYVAVYQKALTPAQILSHYDKGVELGL